MDPHASLLVTMISTDSCGAHHWKLDCCHVLLSKTCAQEKISGQKEVERPTRRNATASPGGGRRSHPEGRTMSMPAEMAIKRIFSILSHWASSLRGGANQPSLGHSNMRDAAA